MNKKYLWKLLKNGELREIETHGPYYDDFKLEEGPWSTIEEAETELEAYYERYKRVYTFTCSEEFVLLTVYSAE